MRSFTACTAALLLVCVQANHFQAPRDGVTVPDGTDEDTYHIDNNIFNKMKPELLFDKSWNENTHADTFSPNMTFKGFCKTHMYELGTGFGWQLIEDQFWEYRNLYRIFDFSDVNKRVKWERAQDSNKTKVIFADKANNALNRLDDSLLTQHLAFYCGFCDFLQEPEGNTTAMTKAQIDEMEQKAAASTLLDFQGVIIYICFIFFLSAALPSAIKKFRRDTKAAAGGMLTKADDAMDEQEEENETDEPEVPGNIFMGKGDEDDAQEGEDDLEEMMMEWMEDKAPPKLRLIFSHLIPALSMDSLGFAMIFSVIAFFTQYGQEGARGGPYCWFHFIVAMPFYPPVLLPLIKLMIKLVKSLEDNAFPTHTLKEEDKDAKPDLEKGKKSVKPGPEEADPLFTTFVEEEKAAVEKREELKRTRKWVDMLKDNAGVLFVALAVLGYSTPFWMFFFPAAIVALPLAAIGILNICVWVTLLVALANLVYILTLAVFHFIVLLVNKLEALKKGKKAKRMKRLTARIVDEYYWLRKLKKAPQWRYIYVAAWGAPLLFVKLPFLIKDMYLDVMKPLTKTVTAADGTKTTTGRGRIMRKIAGSDLLSLDKLPYATIVSLGFSITFGILTFYIGFINLAVYVGNVYPTGYSGDSFREFEDGVQDLYGRWKGGGGLPPATELWGEIFYQKVNLSMAFPDFNGFGSFGNIFRFFDFNFPDYAAFFVDFSIFLGYFAFILDFSVEMVFEPLIDIGWNGDRMDAKQFMQVKAVVKMVQAKVEQLWIRKESDAFPVCRIDSNGEREPKEPIGVKNKEERKDDKDAVSEMVTQTCKDGTWYAEAKHTLDDAANLKGDELPASTKVVMEGAKAMVEQRKSYTPDATLCNLYGLLAKVITDTDKVEAYKTELKHKMDVEYHNNLKCLKDNKGDTEAKLTEQELLATLVMDIRNYTAGSFGMLRNLWGKLQKVTKKKPDKGFRGLVGGKAGMALDPKAFFEDEEIKEHEKNGTLDEKMDTKLDQQIEYVWITLTRLISQWLQRGDAMKLHKFAQFKELKNGGPTVALTPELRKATRAELRKCEVYSKMLYKMGIGLGSFKENAKIGLIGKLDMQDKGSEGDADADEEDVEKLDDAETALQLAVVEKPVEIRAKSNTMVGKKKHSKRDTNDMKTKVVDHSSIKSKWISATAVRLTWKAPEHTHLKTTIEPVRYDVSYRKKPMDQTNVSQNTLADAHEDGWQNVVAIDEKKGDGKVSCELNSLVGSDTALEIKIYAIWIDEGKEHHGILKDTDIKLVQKKRTWASSFLTSQPGAVDAARAPAPATISPPSFWNSRPRGIDEAPVTGASLESALNSAGKE
jgi:hypothetical protein